jgi:hypothetical protein
MWLSRPHHPTQHYPRWIVQAERERKTDGRNGITLKKALMDGRYNEQATRPHALEGRIAEKAKARGNALDRLTSAQ